MKNDNHGENFKMLVAIRSRKLMRMPLTPMTTIIIRIMMLIIMMMIVIW